MIGISGRRRSPTGLPEGNSTAAQKPSAVLCGDLNMLRCFATLEIPTVVATSDPREVTLRSRYCRDKAIIAPPSQPDAAVTDLVRLARRLGDRPVLFYGTDAMLLLISRHRDVLGQHFRFSMPGPDLVERLVDKAQFSELAHTLDLPVPSTLASSQISSPKDILARIGLPCVFKPTVHIGWFKARAEHALSPHKALRANTESELEHTLEELTLHCPSFVVQRYIPGGEDAIYSYHAYLSTDFQPLGEFAGRKIRTYPKQAGVSTYLELVRQPELLALGRELSTRMRLVGPVKIDFKRDDETGRFYLLEVNARYTLWNYLGAKAGVNLPALAFADLTSQPMPDQTAAYRTGVRWLSFGNDLRTFWRDYRRDGSLSTLEWLSSYRAEKVYDIFSWRDPLPFFANAFRYSEAFSRRLLRASHG
jgi:predicted ATP-grasp superfamily ATP-dependent carboligase